MKMREREILLHSPALGYFMKINTWLSMTDFGNVCVIAWGVQCVLVPYSEIS